MRKLTMYIRLPNSRKLTHAETFAKEHNYAIVKTNVTEESYTSGTSFLDNELPIKQNYNKSRKIYRGLFKSNKGRLINSDVNGSLQIMKKVFQNAFSHGIEDYRFNPIRVGL